MALNRAYPTYDATRFPDYQKTRADFTSGKTAQGVNSFNTALGHLSTFYDHISTWSTVPGLKTFSALAGGDAAKLNTDKIAVKTELAKAYAGGQLSEGELKEWDNRLDTVSPLELKTNVKGTRRADSTPSSMLIRISG